MQGDTPLIIKHPEFKNICHTCGTRYAQVAPLNCPVCDDERQYVPASGQKWTSYSELNKSKSIRFSRLLSNVYDLRVSPAFAIAQRAYLVLSPGGNLLWDC